jgi:hypothetical protein
VGVYPNPVLRRVEPAVLEILSQMDRDVTPEAPGEPESADEGMELVESEAGQGAGGARR